MMSDCPKSFTEEIRNFLKGYGFECLVQVRNSFDVLCIDIPEKQIERFILPLEIKASSQEEAAVQAEEAWKSIGEVIAHYGDYPLIVTQDRWDIRQEMMQKRILAHLEVFSPIYARNCEIRRIDKAVAREFLEKTHSYGHATCRYCYGMFLRRHTGHIAAESTAEEGCCSIVPGTLVAVATFSNARKWIKGEQVVRSYEWTRYASLPEARISGGMGRFLKHFIKEVQPDDIMTYADLEWSQGDVYAGLGFTLEGQKAPVMFSIDYNWQRFPVKSEIYAGHLFFRNFGSNKFRMKLTDYE